MRSFLKVILGPKNQISRDPPLHQGVNILMVSMETRYLAI